MPFILTLTLFLCSIVLSCSKEEPGIPPQTPHPATSQFTPQKKITHWIHQKNITTLSQNQNKQRFFLTYEVRSNSVCTYQRVLVNPENSKQILISKPASMPCDGPSMQKSALFSSLASSSHWQPAPPEEIDLFIAGTQLMRTDSLAQLNCVAARCALINYQGNQADTLETF